MSTLDDQLDDDLLPAYVLGALDAPEVARAEAQLAASPESRAELKALRDVVALLPYAAQPVEPPAGVKRQLMARIAASNEDVASPRAAPPARTPARQGPAGQGMRFLARVAVALLLCAVFGLGGAVFSLRGSLDELARSNRELTTSLGVLEQRLADTQAAQATLTDRLAASQRDLAGVSSQLQASRRDLDSLTAQLSQEQRVLTFISGPGVATRVLEAASTGAQARGEMYMYPGHSEAVVLFQGLEPLEPGKIYQFWLANADGQVAAGTVVAGPDGLARLIVQAPREVNAFQEVMLTVEPAGGSTAPSDTVVLEGSL